MWCVPLPEFARKATDEAQLLVAVLEARVPAQRAVAEDPQFGRINITDGVHSPKWDADNAAETNLQRWWW